MTAKIQPTFAKSPSRTYAAMGDSYTYNFTYDTLPSEFYPHRVQEALKALGVPIRSRNFGIGGNTTGQMLARKTAMTQYGVPDIASIYGAANDSPYASTVQASPTPTTTTFAVGAGLGVNYIVGTYVKVGSASRLITAVSTDTITVSPALSSAPSAGTAVAIDTVQNIVSIGQFVKAAGCNRLLVIGRHYQNTTSGFDTTSTQQATWAADRAKQQEAASTLNATYVDLYAHMRARIVAGADVQSSGTWHVLPGDGHLNAYGESIVADAVFAAIQAQGWVNELR